MKCPKCHFDNPDDTVYCGKCATPLKPSNDISLSRTKTLKIPKPTKSIAGKYKILKELGRGGMGIVYKAKDARLKRIVALKFLPPDLTKDPEAKERFIQEAQAAAALDHPNICTVYEVNEEKDQTFISMAYVEGQSLKDRLKSGALDIEVAIDIAIQVAEGLKEAHEKGIVHRDIKPANIVLTEKGQAKITDFGLAKLSWGADLTKTSTIMGTVAYMSPEQAKGEQVNQRTDIWSLGAMLYEMLTGERPFKKSHEQALIYSILNDEPKSITSFLSDIPSHIEDAIQKALEKDVSKRYQNLQELIRDLKEPPSVTLSREKKSIAVLPFKNMSADPEQEYFCDGLTEELINALTQIKDLQVVARTSTFYFKGKDVGIEEIGKKLKVDKVLEGSVRKSGNRLRITAQLINVDNGYHIWSERYDRDMKDIFAVQDEISTAILNKLKVKILKEEEAKLVKRYTENLEAYNFYLKGCYERNKLTIDGFKRGIRYFNAAIENDPTYAMAYGGLAMLYVNWSFWGNLPPNDAYPKVREAAEKALEIDESIAEAHCALGSLYTYYDWNWEGAEQELKRAIELEPKSASNHVHYGFLLVYTRREEEAIFEARLAQELDPLSSIIKGFAGTILLNTQRYGEVIENSKEGLQMDPYNHQLHLMLGLAYFQKAMVKEATAELEKAVELSGSNIPSSLYLGIAYYQSGKKTDADKIFNSLRERARRGDYVPPALFALIHATHSEMDDLFDCLEKAYEEHDNWLPLWSVPPWRNLSGPRIEEILKKIGLE